MLAACKANAMIDETEPESGRGKGAQAAALPARRHPDVRTVVRGVSAGLRHLEQMMAERGIAVDHSTVHRWAMKLLPVLEKAFRRRKRPVGKSWRMDETYIKVKGQWKYLYRAVDKAGNTVDFLLRAHRDKAAARRYFEKSIDRNGEPDTVTIDGSGANLAALEAINADREAPIKIRQSDHVRRWQAANTRVHATRRVAARATG